MLCYTFTIFSSFSIIVGDILQRTAAVKIYQLVTDGEQFVKRIVHGEKVSDNPGYLLFTAPYKLCEGGCKDEERNFAMAFPIYVGKKGKEKYKELYERDSQKIHHTKPNAPFKKKPTKKLFTLCPTEVTKQQTTLTGTEITSQTQTTDAPTLEPETESTILETKAITVSETEAILSENEATSSEIKATETLSETPTTDTPTVPYIELVISETTNSETRAISSESETTMSSIKATKTPTIKKQTVSGTETNMIETSTVFFTTKIATTMKVETTPATNTLTVLETEITATEAPTKVFTAKTIVKTAMPIASMPTSNAPSTGPEKIIMTKVPAVLKTDIPTIKTTPTMPKTESKEAIQVSETEIPTEFTKSQVTETEDITFEDYTDTTDDRSDENEENYITNANGVRCPPRICQKKAKITPKIITLVPYDKRSGKLVSRYAQWNSDYSDLLDSYSY